MNFWKLLEIALFWEKSLFRHLKLLLGDDRIPNCHKHQNFWLQLGKKVTNIMEIGEGCRS